MTVRPLEILVIRADAREARAGLTETVAGNTSLQFIPRLAKGKRPLCVIRTSGEPDRRRPSLG
jgi:hypothetical protein